MRFPLHNGYSPEWKIQLSNHFNRFMTTLQSGASSINRNGWILLLLCIVSLYLFLGSTLFNTRGEPREAVVALSMLKDGNWILPVNNGVDLAYKPPFFHWLVAVGSFLCGGVSEYTSRLPSALALTVMVMAGYFFYARRSNPWLAFWAGLLTISNFEVHRAGINCRVDMVLACMMVLSIYQLCRWVERGMHGIPLWGTLCLSGAFLTKGPVGMALPCLVVAVFALVKGYKWWSVVVRFAVVSVLSLILPALWYVAAYEQGGTRFLHLVYEENVLRLLGKMTYESHVNPWTYNVMTLACGMLPYTLLLVFALGVLPYRSACHAFCSNRWKGMMGRLRSMDTATLISLLSLAIIFVFYCIPKSKRSVYLLPVYPFLCFFLARFILWLNASHKQVLRTFCYVLVALSVLLCIAFAAVRMGIVDEHILGHGKHAAENAVLFSALQVSPLNLLQWLACAVPVVAAAWWLSNRGKLIAGTVALPLAVFLALDGVYQPLVLNAKSDLPQARYIQSLQPQGRIYSFRTDVTPGNPMHPFTINYYLGDRVAPFEAFRPQRGLLLVGNDEIEQFQMQYPQWNVMLVKDFRHKSCDDHKMLKLYRVELRAEAIGVANEGISITSSTTRQAP